MGFMVFRYFADHPLLSFPLIALALFLAVFAALVVRTYSKQAARYDAAARLPLEDRSEVVRD